ERSVSPSGLAGVAPTTGRPATGAAAGSSPHGNRAPSTPPRAARSHSASVGNRADVHVAKRTASLQARPTTGWSGPSKPGLLQNAGGAAPVASRYRAYSRLVTGVRAIRNVSIHTRWRGRSQGGPSSTPIVNAPAGTRTNCTLLRDVPLREEGRVVDAVGRGHAPVGVVEVASGHDGDALTRKRHRSIFDDGWERTGLDDLHGKPGGPRRDVDDPEDGRPAGDIVERMRILPERLGRAVRRQRHRVHVAQLGFGGARDQHECRGEYQALHGRGNTRQSRRVSRRAPVSRASRIIRPRRRRRTTLP